MKQTITNEKNEVYAWEAVQIAKFSGFFDGSRDTDNWSVDHLSAQRHTGGDLQNLQIWREQMDHDIEHRNSVDRRPLQDADGDVVIGDVVERSPDVRGHVHANQW